MNDDFVDDEDVNDDEDWSDFEADPNKRNKLTIPKKIKVGFQRRSGTYTGKLAYVVYTDAKGVLRKEKSWNQWRDSKIEAQEFDNTPTSGFVLNKKVGETRYGWNPRKAWVRIYDPRDFEFEISVANLLFILEETSAIKGKGLEGEFVYAWDGSELVLLPAGSQEYKFSAQFTKLQTKKVTAKDMVEGCLYMTKEAQQVMYLGRHIWYELKDETLKQSKQHIFVSTDGKSNYWPQSGFTKVATRLTEEVSSSYAEEFEKFKNSIHGCKPIKLVEEPVYIPQSKKSNQLSFSAYQKIGEKYYAVNIHGWLSYSNDIRYQLLRAIQPTTFDPTTGKLNIEYPHFKSDYSSIEDFKDFKFYKLYLENEKGNRVSV